jgi:hypothetical protein
MDQPKDSSDHPEIISVTVGDEVTINDKVYVFGDGATSLMNFWLQSWADHGERPRTGMQLTIRSKEKPGVDIGLFDPWEVYQALITKLPGQH